MKREVDLLYVDDIVVPPGRRDVDAAQVEKLASSIKEIGLQTPISVWTGDNETVQLVTGRHRLEAYRLLGKEKIEAIFVEMGERQRRMWEISENLHRAELTALQRSEHIAEWISLARASEISSPPGMKSRVGRPGGGVNAAARELGISKTEAHRATDIAALTPEAKKEAEILHLDSSRDALSRAARQTTKERQIRELREAAVKRAAQQEMSASERRIESAIKTTKKLSHEELEVYKDWFKAYCEDGGAVFDNTAAGRRARANG